MSEATKLTEKSLDELLRRPEARVHFVGVGGTGMSALAQYRVFGKGRVSGSDRSFDRGEAAAEKKSSETIGIDIHPQDGSGVPGAAVCVLSTVVESTIPDVLKARELGIPMISRAELLAAFVRSRKTIAIAGTSGKSSVVAMTFEALRGAGMDPGVITGGDLKLLKGHGRRGNAHFGTGPLVIEADESDKSLVHYEPEIGVLLNLQRDHDEPDALLPVFAEFKRRTKSTFIVADDDNLESLRIADNGARVLSFGFSEDAQIRAYDVVLEKDGARFSVGTTPVAIPLPGRHNVLNATAALAAAHAAGADPSLAASALARYHGVSRRFERIALERGIEIIDDFAHNPAKIEATIMIAKARADRVLAFFQPHGFGPMRFMGKDIVDVFARSMRPRDRVYFPEIYYAGGSAVRDVSSKTYIDDMKSRGVDAWFVESRDDIAKAIAAEARSGDLILLMGARDPTLPDFARTVAAAVTGRS